MQCNGLTAGFAVSTVSSPSSAVSSLQNAARMTENANVHQDLAAMIVFRRVCPPNSSGVGVDDGFLRRLWLTWRLQSVDRSEAMIIGPRKARTSANVTKVGPVSIAMSVKKIKRAIVSYLEGTVACATSRALL